jgi:hypothetical protein
MKLNGPWACRKKIPHGVNQKLTCSRMNELVTQPFAALQQTGQCTSMRTVTRAARLLNLSYQSRRGLGRATFRDESIVFLPGSAPLPWLKTRLEAILNCIVSVKNSTSTNPEAINITP